MATSQDFVNWVCSKGLEPEFLKYLFVAEGEGLLRFASGAVHQTIYFPEAKAFHICHPPAHEQRRIVAILDEAFASIAIAKANAENNLQNARELFESERDEVFERRGSGYSRRSLSEICVINSQLVDPRKKEFLNLIHIGAGNMESETGVLANLQTAREENLISGKFLFEKSAVLYSKIRPYLRKAARPDFAGLCSADVYPLDPIEGYVTRDYLYHLLLSNFFTKYAIEGVSQGRNAKGQPGALV